MEQAEALRAVNAAIINISGRQRMLSQRAAMFALRLTCTQDQQERTVFRQELTDIAHKMESFHRGLLDGNPDLHLPGQPSPVVHDLYFAPPWQVDRQIHQFLQAILELIEIPDAELNHQHPTLQIIVNAASTSLLAGLDTIVRQYQQESDTAQQEMMQQQQKLYQQSIDTTKVVQAQAARLETALNQLQKTQAQLIQTEKLSSLGLLVAGVAHEINNPVNFIAGNLPLIQEYVHSIVDVLHLYQQHCPKPGLDVETAMENADLEFLLEDLPKLLASLKAGTDRIEQIVRTLRNFVRTDESRFQAINLHECLDSTLTILQHRLKARIIRSGETEYTRPTISVTKQYGPLPLVDCKAGPLNQVWMNLLSNAIDALEEIPAQSVPTTRWEITIRTEVLSPEWVRVSIADTGAGIPLDVQPRLFEPFFTTKPIGKGTGLGLPISYEIVTEMHCGKMNCCSMPDQGTEFVIDLPVQQVETGNH